jgi:hypothetical protein
MEKVYIVERRTWMSKDIIEVFKNKSDADNFANDMESSKAFSDGYNEYYVVEFKIK